MEFFLSKQYVNKVWLYKGIRDLCLNLTITYKTNPFPDNDKNNGTLFYDSVQKKNRLLDLFLLFKDLSAFLQALSPVRWLCYYYYGIILKCGCSYHWQ